MIGLLDGDLLTYELGELKNEDGDVISLAFTIETLHQRLSTIKERSGCSSLEYFLTGKDNFRKDIATIVPYKGTRKVEKPKWYKAIRHELEVNLKANVIDGMEADDALSIRQYATILEEDKTCIITRDKDLHMVPGFHYSWSAGNCKEKPLWKQTMLGGLRCFYKQLLTGDSVDNILGLFGVGRKSALLKKLDDMDTEQEMFSHVYKCYQDRFGSYAFRFLAENGCLLWMLQHKGQQWQEIAGILLAEHVVSGLQAD